MSLREEHRRIRGTDVEAALMLLSGAPPEHRHLGLLEREFGDQRGLRAHENLRKAGYIEPEQSLAYEADLTPDGERLIAHILRARSRGGSERNEAVRRALLRWLADEPQDSSSAAFVGSAEPPEWGDVYTLAEADEAAEYLDGQGLIKSLGTNEAAHLRSAITSKGRSVLAVDDETIEDQMAPHMGPAVHHDSRSYSTTFNAPVGAVAQGDHATQHVSQIVAPEVVASARERLAKLREDPAVARSPELVEALDNVDVELSAPAPERAKIISTLGKAFTTAVATAAGTSVVEAVTALTQLVTGSM